MPTDMRDDRRWRIFRGAILWLQIPLLAAFIYRCNTELEIQKIRARTEGYRKGERYSRAETERVLLIKQHAAVG